ncbi:MAG: hypothetical protein DRN27_03695 [Thermoplasmata archaeon]|nr:MAG: hypothetical protein DRN27_03695 [Thermoplasmata archaeon]
MKLIKSVSAIFIILIILLSTTTSVIGNKISIDERLSNENLDPFMVKLSDEEMNLIDEYIKEISTSTDRLSLKEKINQIFTNENELNVEKLYNGIAEYGFDTICHFDETIDITDDLYNFIFTMIEDRLGWIYDCFLKTSDLLYDAKNLLNDVGMPREILNDITLLIEKLQELQILLTYLIEKEYIQFLKAWSPGIIIEDITSIIESIELISSNLGELIGDIQSFVYDASDFVSWFASEPWMQPIHIYGQVMKGINGLSNITVSCQEESGLTDGQGFFDFYVDALPSNNSIPPEIYYGLHQNVIQIQYNDELLQTPSELSYVFSDGGIYWLFIVKNKKQENNNPKEVILDSNIEYYNNFFSRDNPYLNYNINEFNVKINNNIFILILKNIISSKIIYNN